MNRNDAGIQVITNCTSAEQFVSRFQKFCDGTSIFIPTVSPVGVGTRDHFSIALTTGETVLSGYGVVIESQTPAACGGSSRMAGMRIQLEQIDPACQSVFQWLVAARKLSGATGRHPVRAPIPMERDSVGAAPRLVVAHAAAFAVGLATAYLVWGGVA